MSSSNKKTEERLAAKLACPRSARLPANLPVRTVMDATLLWKQDRAPPAPVHPAAHVQAFLASPGNAALRCIKGACMSRRGLTPEPAFVERQLGPVLPDLMRGMLRQVVATSLVHRASGKWHTVALSGYPDGGRSAGQSRLELPLALFRDVTGVFLQQLQIRVVVRAMVSKDPGVDTFHKDLAKPKSLEKMRTMADGIKAGLTTSIAGVDSLFRPTNMADRNAYSTASIIIFDDDSFSGVTAEACLQTCERDLGDMLKAKQLSCSTAVLYASHAYWMYFAQEPRFQPDLRGGKRVLPGLPRMLSLAPAAGGAAQHPAIAAADARAVPFTADDEYDDDTDQGASAVAAAAASSLVRHVAAAAADARAVPFIADDEYDVDTDHGASAAAAASSRVPPVAAAAAAAADAAPNLVSIVASLVNPQRAESFTLLPKPQHEEQLLQRSRTIPEGAG